MKEILFGRRNQYRALVDDTDFDTLSAFNWRPLHTRSGVYAKFGRGPTATLMHRLVMGLTVGDGIKVDHQNGNTLDNQRHNLRIATNSQNICNAKKQSNNTTGYRGVTRLNNNRKNWTGHYKAEIWIRGKYHFLGVFSDAESAARARDAAAIELHGEFARLNFPTQIAA